MAKPNYSFEKRQRELAKKKKKEEKLRDKADRKGGPDDTPQDGNNATSQTDTATQGEGSAPAA